MISFRADQWRRGERVKHCPSRASVAKLCKSPGGPSSTTQMWVIIFFLSVLSTSLPCRLQLFHTSASCFLHSLLFGSDFIQVSNKATKGNEDCKSLRLCELSCLISVNCTCYDFSTLILGKASAKGIYSRFGHNLQAYIFH